MEKRDSEKVFVFGVARSGGAAALMLAGKGARVVVWDDDRDRIEAFLRENSGNGRFSRIEAAGNAEECRKSLLDCDTMVLSPGVPLDHDLVLEAKRNGVAVIGELEAAYRYCTARVIAVTGTNGKSTTTDLVGRIMEESGSGAVVAGNIGTPLSAVVDEANRVGTVVLEVSSFQLDTIDRFRADIAAVLNVTPDHLDRYGDSFERYAASKRRILDRADKNTFFVYNHEDPVCLDMARESPAAKIPFSSERSLEGGIFFRNGKILCSVGGSVEEIIERSEFSPKGVHNLENAMAAVGIACAGGVDREAMKRALRSYRPLPHRMELVRVANGVAYINDSKATNIDAAIKSIRSIDGEVILIMGGRDKNGDFTALYPVLSRVKLVVLIGEAKEKIAGVLRNRCEIREAAGMEEAVRTAAAVAVAGDTVLLAPACASFDMFADYKERGEAFRDCVKAVAA